MKEQNLIIVPAENHTVEFYDEAARPTKETALVTGKDSVGDSSTHCSDVDDSEEEETSVEEGSGWIKNLPISSTIVQRYQTVATVNDDIVLPNADPSNFGNVRVKDSTNVHLGNKTFYKGQITIKQFVYTNSTPIQKADELDATRGSDVNISDTSMSKNDESTNRFIFPQNTKLNKGNSQSFRLLLVFL